MPHSHATNIKLRKMIQGLAAKPLFEIGKNAKYNFSQLMKLPIAAALENRSIENQSLLKGRVSADDFYYHFKNKLEMSQLVELQRSSTSSLCRFLRRAGLWKTSGFTIAIDKTEDPYWGDKGNPFVTGGKREKSTNYAFRELTASIVLDGHEFLIYARALTKDDNDDARLVEECLLELDRLRIPVKRLLMDREFYNWQIILLCNAHGKEYVIPVVKNERFKRLIKELQHEGKMLPRIIENYEVDKEVTNLVIYEGTDKNGETQIYGFITNAKAGSISTDVYSICEIYRGRWGIENAHKYHDSFRIPTNCTGGLIRFLFFLIGMLLHNLWVLLNLLSKDCSLIEISLVVLKDILRAFYGFAATPSYKHPQRERWAKILLGKNTTKKQRKSCDFLIFFTATFHQYFRW